MSDFPSLEIYFVNTKQGENTIFVRKKKDTSMYYSNGISLRIFMR